MDFLLFITYLFSISPTLIVIRLNISHDFDSLDSNWLLTTKTVHLSESEFTPAWSNMSSSQINRPPQRWRDSPCRLALSFPGSLPSFRILISSCLSLLLLLLLSPLAGSRGSGPPSSHHWLSTHLCGTASWAHELPSASSRKKNKKQKLARSFRVTVAVGVIFFQLTTKTT